jgi:hypothetical protein
MAISSLSFMAMKRSIGHIELSLDEIKMAVP